MADAPNGNGNRRWQEVTGVATVAVVLLALMGGLIALNVELANVSYQAATNADAQRALAARVARLEDQAAVDHIQLAQFQTALKEIETQFCAQADSVNLMHANDLRLLAAPWFKVYGQVYPTDNAYYPSTGRCKT